MGKSRWQILLIAGLLALLTLGCGLCPLTVRPWEQGTTTERTTVLPEPKGGSARPTATVLSEETQAALDLARADQQVMIDLYARWSPSVVNVNVRMPVDSETMLEVPDHEGLEQTAQGSGFVYDEAGHIVTNYHVIADATAIEVILSDGETLPAEVVGGDAYSDLAVLRVEAPAGGLPPVHLGDSSQLLVGQKVFAIGNPYGFSNTLTTGIVSSVGRVIRQDTGYSIPRMIQTDTAINPGNSGGPLLDLDGRVVGINTLIYTNSGSSSGVGFAIPIESVIRVVPSLIENGSYEHPWLGVRGESLTRQMLEAMDMPADSRGALIEETVQGGPADLGGLRGGDREVELPGYADSLLAGGDLIIAVGDCPVVSFDDLITCLETTRVGDEVTITYIREGKTQKTVVVVQPRPEQ